LLIVDDVIYGVIIDGKADVKVGRGFNGGLLIFFRLSLNHMDGTCGILS